MCVRFTCFGQCIFSTSMHMSKQFFSATLNSFRFHFAPYTRWGYLPISRKRLIRLIVTRFAYLRAHKTFIAHRRHGPAYSQYGSAVTSSGNNEGNNAFKKLNAQVFGTYIVIEIKRPELVFAMRGVLVKRLPRGGRGLGMKYSFQPNHIFEANN